jgi:hypothetical protein
VSDLADLVEPLKRELAVPGDFDTIFPNTDDQGLLDSLADGFSEAQLDGYFTDYVVDLDTYLTTPDYSSAGGSLVILYTGMRIIRAQLRALNLTEKYMAGPVSYEIERSSTLLREELKYLISRRDDLVTAAKAASRGSDSVFDSYFTRSATNWSVQTGFFPAELG